MNIQHRFEEGYSPEDLDELCLDFREPLPVSEKVQKHRRVGSLLIDVGTSGARLERGGRTLVNSSDSVAKVLEEFPKMVGSRLVRVEVRPPGGDTEFHFQNDLILNCFHARSRGNNPWTVVTEDGDSSAKP
jgi:hypothetical protein